MRIAFFGGAFDPFHSEHEEIANAAICELSLDRLILVPTQNPPHKENAVTDFSDRLNMLSLWGEGKPETVIDPIEASTGKVNCSYEIIRLLKDKYKADKYYYIIGGDSMINFHTWVKPEVIAKEITLAVAARQGFEGLDEAITHAQKAYGADIIKLNAVGKEISSGELKARLELYFDVSEYIDGRIESYVKEKGLYRNYTDIINNLKASISPGLFGHCARTAVFAARYCTLAKVSFHKAFVAGLLHDCAKESESDTTGYPTEAKQVVHQYKGAEIAQKEYGVKDEEILSAIRYHTTGKPAMTRLEKLIYIADKLEDGRRYQGVEELREAVKISVDEAFLRLITHSAAYLKAKGIKADGLTNDCINYYTLQ